MRILVAEDDPRLGPSLKKGLEENHYAVDLVADGEEALSVEWVVQAHGGTISVVSQPGQGASFTVQLPLASSVDK